MKHRLFPLLLIGFMLILSFAGCGNSSATGLEDIRWVLESYGAQDNPHPVIEGTEITATFHIRGELLSRFYANVKSV